MKNKFMAFWKCDLFPYLLCGEIDYKVEPRVWKGKLTYYIPSFQGHFAPEFILSLKDGKILENLLDELKRQKRLAEKRLDEEYNQHLKRILSENGIEGE